VSNSWLTIQATLKRTKIILEEVSKVMLIPNSATPEVKRAYDAVKNLIEDKDKHVQAASEQIEYKKLIRKLEAEKMPLTKEELEDAAKW
jgi:uncharacterized protein YwgA